LVGKKVVLIDGEEISISSDSDSEIALNAAAAWLKKSKKRRRGSVSCRSACS